MRSYRDSAAEIGSAAGESRDQVLRYIRLNLLIFLETIRKCTDIDELNPEIINRLIRRIEGHNSEKVNGKKCVKIDVYFTAVGLIDLPDETELLKTMEEIRKSA